MKNDPGAVYRACVAEVPAARKRWAEAELAWHACARPREGLHRWPDCACGECGDRLLAAEQGVTFAKACVIAAGEAVKGDTFDHIVASQGQRPTPRGI